LLIGALGSQSRQIGIRIGAQRIMAKGDGDFIAIAFFCFFNGFIKLGAKSAVKITVNNHLN
jgi:hypothetical protein